LGIDDGDVGTQRIEALVRRFVLQLKLEVGEVFFVFAHGARGLQRREHFQSGLAVEIRLVDETMALVQLRANENHVSGHHVVLFDLDNVAGFDCAGCCRHKVRAVKDVVSEAVACGVRFVTLPVLRGRAQGAHKNNKSKGLVHSRDAFSCAGVRKDLQDADQQKIHVGQVAELLPEILEQKVVPANRYRE
jgi:hypothetical protein